MHELSIALKVLDIVADECERHGNVPVQAVHVRLGVLSGVVREALESAFAIACQGTPFDQTRLLIDVVPMRIHCPNCRADHAVESPNRLCCPECGRPAVEVIGGDDLEVTSMEIVMPTAVDNGGTSVRQGLP